MFTEMKTYITQSYESEVSFGGSADGGDTTPVSERKVKFLQREGSFGGEDKIPLISRIQMLSEENVM